MIRDQRGAGTSIEASSASGDSCDFEAASPCRIYFALATHKVGCFTTMSMDFVTLPSVLNFSTIGSVERAIDEPEIALHEVSERKLKRFWE
jgi:hypothetical protein